MPPVSMAHPQHLLGFQTRFCHSAEVLQDLAFPLVGGNVAAGAAFEGLPEDLGEYSQVFLLMEAGKSGELLELEA